MSYSPFTQFCFSVSWSCKVRFQYNSLPWLNKTWSQHLTEMMHESEFAEQRLSFHRFKSPAQLRWGRLKLMKGLSTFGILVAGFTLTMTLTESEPQDIWEGIRVSPRGSMLCVMLMPSVWSSFQGFYSTQGVRYLPLVCFGRLVSW